MRGLLRTSMAADMVNSATSEKLKEMDWAKNIEICELITHDPLQSNAVIKSIKKQLKNKNVNTQYFSVMLLEMVMNNCGEQVHKQVIDNEILSILVKIVKKKSDLPVRERIFLLLDATQTALGGASGKYPQYYAAYFELVSSGVQFSQQPHVVIPQKSSPQKQANNFQSQEFPSQKLGNVVKQLTTQSIPDSSVIHKASSVLEVLRDVLNALDPKLPLGASDEFILDLVEQCSFQKQRIMQLVMTSRDEKLVTQAIELNEQLHQVLCHHDRLLSVNATATPACDAHGEGEEEEDAESLWRRIRKGKACAEEDSDESVNIFRSVPKEKMSRPIIRPLFIQPSELDGKPCPPDNQSIGLGSKQHSRADLPPPPSQHRERESFFNNKAMDSSGLAAHVRGLSLHNHDSNSSGSCSTDSSERDVFGFRD
ncbi:TOM1-like protein 5 isoform X1 [Zingiber officinale]|uniref:TOM1-like protein 5 isoform X1 n=2 Tax=Zingiber officinale TaxID=94328 RepID=UPI001C4CA3A8|nr:TOM1-like protein 5 isoform X1 [Zingiber officinale]